MLATLPPPVERRSAATAPAPPLVLDLPLLLGPFGPWLVQRLAATGAVCLPRTLLRWLEERESELAGDALALAAARSRERPVLLSALLPGRTVPAAVDALDRFAVATHRLEEGEPRRRLAGPLVDRLVDARVLGLAACGLLRVGFVERCLPQAPRPLPAARPWPTEAPDEPDELLLTGDGRSAGARVPWNDAVAIWDELR